MQYNWSNAELNRSPRGARAISALCCLLLLFPLLSARAAIVVGLDGKETEESRQSNEEERSAEEPLDVRGASRRTVEPVHARLLPAVHRGASSCLLASGKLANSARTPVEHALRNGLGGPLRL